MNCRRIRKIILADYIDNEISRGLKEKVDKHLSLCLDCRSFFESLVKEIREPLREEEEIKPPELVWVKIKNYILSRNKERGLSIKYI
ncbi:MAG: zf-HC2 domain-containing protein [Candidatus Omnitrophica bacterium]|nr:zf-HC2 domain-containing protein [Candidatus Omnitrophota bacterium]